MVPTCRKYLKYRLESYKFFLLQSRNHAMSGIKKQNDQGGEKMAKAKKGDLFSCDVCGLVVAVDETCDCVVGELICCDVPMEKGKAPAKAKKKAAKPAKKAAKPAKAKKVKAAPKKKAKPVKKAKKAAKPKAKAKKK
jgi:hypothetical protein